jgi:putative transposase
MPRALRSDIGGEIYHALNRGNARNKIFFKPGDFEAFERVIKEGLEKYPVDLFAYQWMSNHWHMVLSPQTNKAMSGFLGWVTMTHTQRYHAHHKTAGYGPVYHGQCITAGIRAFRFRTTNIFTRSAGTWSAMH